MKTFLLVVMASLSFSLTFGQINLSAEKWQEDLRYLQKTLHDDYSFLFKKVTAAEFDAAVDEHYSAIPNLEEHEIIVGIARIIALFKYGHTSMGLSGWYDREPLHMPTPEVSRVFPKPRR